MKGTFLLVLSSAAALPCFHKEDPPSCMPPGVSLPPLENAQRLCHSIQLHYFDKTPYNGWDKQDHWKAFSHIIDGSNVCMNIRKAYPYCYWCTINEPRDYCETCVEPNWVDYSIDTPATCNELKELKDRGEKPATVDLCHRARYAAHSCPDVCWTQDPSHATIVMWLTQLSATLSLLGCGWIMRSLNRQHAQGGICMTQSLMAGMLFFDMMAAAAWLLSHKADGHSKHACTGQAFFLQWGMVSAGLYNATIVMSLVFQRVKGRFSHGLPLIVGLTLAILGFPSYGSNNLACHFAPGTGRIGLFVGIPVALVFLILAASLAAFTSRKQGEESRHLVFGLTALFYLSGLFWWALYYAKGSEHERAAFPLLLSVLSPLHGFGAFLILRKISAVPQKEIVLDMDEENTFCDASVREVI